MINKTNWTEYTGSDEQIAEIKNNKNGYIVRNLNPYDAFILSSRIRYAFELWGDSIVDFEYLICNPHPLADMICQQARTGQPVWVRYKREFEYCVFMNETIKTTTPDWNILNAEYSFTEFEKSVDK